MPSALPHLYARTYSPRVLPIGWGETCAFFRLDYNEKLFAKNYKDPILLPTAFSLEDKTHLALQLQNLGPVGVDLAANPINDLIAHAAEPLFLHHRLTLQNPDPGPLHPLLQALSDTCLQSPCALLGGYSAVAAPQTNFTTFALAVIEKNKMLNPNAIEPGDSVLGLASDGLHAAGFHLVRQILEKSPAPLHNFLPELNATLADELLRPTRLYAAPIRKLLATYKVKRIIKAMAHITTGGLPAALPQLLPEGLSLRLKTGAWTVPPIFPWLQNHGAVHADEMLTTFNMGIGFLLIVRPTFTKPILTHLRTLGEKPSFLGKIKKGDTPKLEWA